MQMVRISLRTSSDIFNYLIIWKFEDLKIEAFRNANAKSQNWLVSFGRQKKWTKKLKYLTLHFFPSLAYSAAIQMR